MQKNISITLAYGVILIGFAYILESEKYLMAIGFGVIAGLLGLINEKLHEMNKILQNK